MTIILQSYTIYIYIYIYTHTHTIGNIFKLQDRDNYILHFTLQYTLQDHPL